MTGFDVTNQNQSLVKSELRHYFIRLTICNLFIVHASKWFDQFNWNLKPRFLGWLSCIFNFLYTAASSTFREECDNLPIKNPKISPPYALSGDGLQCKHVIVTSDAHTIKELLVQGLYCADQVKSKSVSLPALALNFSGYSANQHCYRLVDAMVQYFQQNPSSCIKEVHFVDHYSVSRAALRKALEDHAEIQHSPKGRQLKGTFHVSSMNK